jgi:hypothetical protein
MGATLPLHPLVVDQAHVGLIDQSGGLQAVTGPLAPHVAAGEATEVVLDDGSQPVERGTITVTPCAKKSAELARPPE